MKLMTKTILTVTLFFLLTLFSGQISDVKAQETPSGCGTTITSDGECTIYYNSNRCPVNTGPLIAGTSPNCSCECSPIAPVLNTQSAPNLGNDCRGTNCGYPDSGMSCQEDDNGRLQCLSDDGDQRQSRGEGEPSSNFSSDQPPTICVVEQIFSQILTYSLGFAGLALFIMIIIGSFRWLTAGTNEKTVQQARKTLVYALLGLALVVGAWYILQLVRQFTGIDVTSFGIPGC